MTSPFLSPKLLASPRYLIRGPRVNITSKAASTGQKELSISTTCGSLPMTHSPLERIRQGHPKVRVIPPRSRGTAATVGSTLWWRSLTSSGSSIGCLKLLPWRGCCCMDIRYLSESERKQVSSKIKILKYVFFTNHLLKFHTPNYFFFALRKNFEELFFGVMIKIKCALFLYIGWYLYGHTFVRPHVICFQMKETLMAQQGGRARSSSRELLKLSKSSLSRYKQHF